MRQVADSFAWPFRAGTTTWLIGVFCVLLLPLLFVPLLGYAVAATRAAEEHPSEGPPPWQLSRRLLSNGLVASVAVVLTFAPFAVVLNPLADALHRAGLGEPFPHLFALLILALPWGIVALLLLPFATATFAATGKPSDMFDVSASLRRLRRDFSTWNVAAAAMVTAWAIGVACIGVLCVGLVPGVFYAILVSAHAAAALEGEGPGPSAG